jgi:putative endopeptidase
MDQTRIEQLGAKPLASAVDQVPAAKMRDDLAAFAGRNASNLDGTLFTLNIDADLKNPERYTVYVNQGGLGLPDRDYYLKPEFAVQKKNYQGYVAQLLRLIEWPAANARAKNVVEFETRIAGASWTKV